MPSSAEVQQYRSQIVALTGAAADDLAALWAMWSWDDPSAVTAAALGVVLWRTRSVRQVFAPEILIAAGLATFNLALVAYIYPDFYRRALPDALQLYAPARGSFFELVSSMGFVVSAIV